MLARTRGVLAATTVFAMLSAGAAPASAGVPQLLAEQGHLADQNGNSVAGQVTIVFAIYGGASGGNKLWSETQTITLDDGFFSAVLGESSAIPPALFNGPVRYLGV